MKIVQNRLLVLSIGALLSMPISAAEPRDNNDASLCPRLNIPKYPSTTKDLQPGDTYLVADEADLVEEGASKLSGETAVTRDNQRATANTIVYKKDESTARLSGSVNYWDDTIYLNADTAFLKLDDNIIGRFANTNFIIKDSRGRGVASKILRDAGRRTDMDEAEYTTCDAANQFWKLYADRVELDHEKQQGEAEGVVLKVKDFPVFYSPYLSFPLKEERKSGFLAPSYGSTNKHGFELGTPYYWNISPNMDATLTPRVLTDSGVMLVGEYRYLLEHASGEINLEYLPSDNQFEDRSRNAFSLAHRQRFLNNRGSLFLNYNRVSDQLYFEDFGNQLSISSTRFLERRADILYNGGNWNLTVRLQDYQTVDRSLAATSRPYKRLPQILFNYTAPRAHNKINYGISTETVYFQRGNNDQLINANNNNVNGFRAHIQPYISYPMRTTATFLEPKLTLDYTQYELEASRNFGTSPNRLVPVFSLDGGLFLEREAMLAGTNYLHTLEPRFFYLYVPRVDQSDLPIFDTGLLTNSFPTLFRDNRFNGNDRRADANQVTLAVTSRLINQASGRELGQLNLGQIFYFQDREVTLPGQTILNDDSSSLIAALSSSYFTHWNISSDIIYNPHSTHGTERITTRAIYSPSSNRILNMSYRIRRDGTDIEQSDISFKWPVPVIENLSAVGRWNHAIPEGRSLELFAGIEYESCCWNTRLVGRRFLTDIDGDFDTGVFFQIQLKGLAGTGKKTVDFLQQQIPGYERDF